VKNVESRIDTNRINKQQREKDMIRTNREMERH